MTPADLDLLIHRYFEGTLSPAEEITFLDLIRRDPAAADRFVEMSELESGMLEGLGEDEEMPSAVYAAVHGSRRRSRALRVPEARRPVWPYWAAAALFIVAVTLVLRMGASSTSTPEALTRQAGVPPPEELRPPAPVRSKADLEADRAKHQKSIQEYERQEQILHEALAQPATKEEREAQDRKLEQIEKERREAAAKLVKTEEDLAKPEPTQVVPPAPPPGPIVESAEGDVAWAGPAPKAAQPGDPVAPGAELLTRGPRSRAVLRLVDESRIELRGDSRLEAIQAAADQKTFTLTQGSLAASITKQAASRSIVFLTAHAELTVVGTRLLVVTGPEETRLDVEEGRVRNKRRSDGRSIDVLANHTVTTAKSGPLVAKPLPVVRSFQDGVLPTPDYAGTQDTSIGSGTPTATSGTLDLLRLYREPRGDLQNSVLIRWDLSSIPGKSRVASAEVSFWVTGGLAPPGARGFELLRPWSEAEASWKVARSGLNWLTPGARGSGDINPAPLVAIAPTVTGWCTFPFNEAGLVAVQRWVNAPKENYGFAITKEPPNAWDLASREWATPEHRPKLTVTYLPPAK
jgi:hypothetical protein